MRIRMLGSSVGPEASGGCQYLTSFLVNDRIAIDAGSLGYLASLDRQARVTHVLLTHSHSDHIASLPVFVENTLNETRVVRIGATVPTLDCLRRDVFNGRIWPDFVNMTRDSGGFLELMELEPEKVHRLEGIEIIPVEMDHTVPTVGFILRDENACVVIAGDTGPTRRIWELARHHGPVAGVFLESSFPDEEAELARLTGHLTPTGFRDELEKLGHPVRGIAYHVKAKFRDAVSAQLGELGVEVGVEDVEYDFS